MALVWSFLANLLTFAVLLHAQPGFLSIDCGIDEDLSYTDDKNQMFYTSDATFIDTGSNKDISKDYISQTPRQYQNLRFFPDGTRNCYTLTPVIRSNRYLLRASFMYGNYDGLNQPPQFGAYVGVNPWDVTLPSNSTQYVHNEIIMVASLDYISVCLVNTGRGIPFISTLELRLLNNNSTYKVASMSQSLQLYSREHFGSNYDGQIRFPDDTYDRIWYSWGQNSWVQINTTGPINFREDIGYKPPAPIMNSGVMSLDLDNLSFYFPTSNIDPTLQYYVYMHFAELEILPSTQYRQFNFYIDGHYSFGPFSPEYLSVNTIVTSTLSNRDQHVIDLCKTTSSLLPPILNAMEIFFIQQLLATPTDSKDVDAIMSIKTAYEIRRNWMGDPCVPLNYIWEGLNCSYPDLKPPTIISLDLSSSRLTGEISTLLANLTSIQSLDVSNNSLTGPVPNLLAKLPSLKFLNLSNNNLTGTIPTVLLERSKKGSLSLSIDNNPHLVGSSIVPVNNNIIPCQGGSCKKRRKTVVHIVAPVILALIMLIVMVYVFRRINQRRRKRDPVVELGNASGPLLYADQQITSPEVVEANNTGGPLLFQHQQITSSQANHVVEAHRTGSPLLFEVQQITSPEDLVEETNNTGDALLSEGRQIISTNGGSFIYEVPQNITAADTVAGASKIGGSLPSESRQVTSAESMSHNQEHISHNQEHISVHVEVVLDPDPVVNETGSSLISEDHWITCPEDPVVKANRTGSSLLSKNRPFTYDEVSVITTGFKRFLGKGAFGMVFHGEMTDGTELAVKRLFPQPVKLLSELSKQFENEAQLLMRVHHRNLVPFIGYCQEGDNMALLYEYMAEGDLGSHLLGKKGNSKALNWDQRLHIGLDVAQGLEYLHDGCNPPIIHRDIKTANILLNERFEAKIGDFGLSKVFLKYDESSHITTGIKGTEGYIDPEYDTSKHLTKKSDVYSFGVVLFQLITAKRATFQGEGTEKIDLVDWANHTIALAPIECVVDPKLEGVHDTDSLKKAAEIARLCTSKKSEERPTMCEVVAKLKDCLEIEAAAERIRVLVNVEQQVE